MSREPDPPGSRPQDSGATGRATRIALLLGLLAVALWIFATPPGANDIDAGEGYYGVQARSLLEDPRFRLSPPLVPGDGPGFKQPFYPALLALGILVDGPHEAALRWPSLLAAIAIATALAQVVARSAGIPAGVSCAVLLLGLPWFADASRSSASVIATTAFGAWAVALASSTPLSVGRATLAGAMIGLAFECKMWMAVVPLLGVIARLAHRDRGSARAWAGLLVAAAVTGGAHLAAVALFERETLGEWLAFYFRRFLLDRLEARDIPAHFALPPTFYWPMLAHALVLALPLVGVGIAEALRRRDQPAGRMVLGWAAGLLLISAFSVKSGPYLYTVLPAWVALAGIGAAAFARGAAAGLPWVAALGLASAPPVIAALGGAAPPLPVWAAAWGLFGAALLARRMWPRQAPFAALALVVFATAGGVLRQAQRLPKRYHDPGYRHVAEVLAPVVREAPRGKACFLAPEAPAFAYYWFRTGSYWGLPEDVTPEERLRLAAADTSLRVFVFDPTGELYRGASDSLTLAWLESSTREVTGEIERRAGRRIAVRVFVRPSVAPGVVESPVRQRSS